MKIRTDFVTNSSSSSFLIIGTEDDKLVEKLLDAEGFKKPEDDEDESYYECDGYKEGKVVSFFGWDSDMYAAGYTNIEELLEKHTLPQAKQIIVESIYDNLGVQLEVDDLDLICGEYGND